LIAKKSGNHDKNFTFLHMNGKAIAIAGGMG
jgi:hypothetical protein